MEAKKLQRSFSDVGFLSLDHEGEREDMDAWECTCMALSRQEKQIVQIETEGATVVWLEMTRVQ